MQGHRTNLVMMLAVMTILTAMIAIGGCATAIKDKSVVHYVDPGFSEDHLKTFGLAMLPVVAGQGQEGYRRPIAECLSAGVRRAMADGRFLDWRETMDALNEQDLADDYESLIGTYRETAILREEMVSQLGEALRVRYLLFVSLEEFHTRTSTSYSVFTGIQSQRKAAVNAFCQVWDCATGDVVWEGSAAAESVGGELSYDKPYEEYARTAAEGLVGRLFGGDEKAR
ncbi:MAG: hypothetical protein KAY32_03840 [Candidatus Eisenbacteria sp.]|nr:hypothetical protein [Candidatus Eisenbacteria bacterium]